MAQELTMPKLSDSMADAVIVRWLKSPGEEFARGEPLIEVETDKATVVYEAEADGTLGAILIPEGGTASVGEPIATLANGEGPGPVERPVAAAQQPVAAEQSVAAEQPVAARAVDRAANGGGRPNATPVARRTAVALGISLRDVAGTGPGGRITRKDVEEAAAEGPPSARPTAAGGRGEVDVLKLTSTQATIARRMAESASTIPTFTVSADIDVSLVAALRRGAREEREDAPSLNDFFVKAVAATLREFPRFNASYIEGAIECYGRINVGVAVAAEDALLVPVVFDADRKTLGEISAETRRLADAARRRTLQPDELQNGTFTVSNLGMFGVRSFTAIIDLPQTAILAVGGGRREPVEEPSGGVGFRDVLTVNLTCDHRVVYGADAARFLARLRELFERPLILTL